MVILTSDITTFEINKKWYAKSAKIDYKRIPDWPPFLLLLTVQRTMLLTLSPSTTQKQVPVYRLPIKKNVNSFKLECNQNTFTLSLSIGPNNITVKIIIIKIKPSFIFIFIKITMLSDQIWFNKTKSDECAVDLIIRFAFK